MQSTSRFTLIAVVALLGACVADEGDPQLEVTTAALQQDPVASDVAAEAVALYQELAARLEARGVTPEEMQAAVDAGDPERVRELLDLSDAEYAAWEALATMAESTPEHPDGWFCTPELVPCITAIGLGFLVRGAYSIPRILAYGGIHVAGCVYAYCGYDRTDPGPPVGRP